MNISALANFSKFMQVIYIKLQALFFSDDQEKDYIQFVICLKQWLALWTFNVGTRTILRWSAVAAKYNIIIGFS